MEIFDKFDIDNYEELFIQNGFVKLDKEHEYECDACCDVHTAEIFEKDGEWFYFNYEFKDVVDITYLNQSK